MAPAQYIFKVLRPWQLSRVDYGLQLPGTLMLVPVGAAWLLATAGHSVKKRH
jgi:hypothetical protein